jgi:hypothetical protein
MFPKSVYKFEIRDVSKINIRTPAWIFCRAAMTSQFYVYEIMLYIYRYMTVRYTRLRTGGSDCGHAELSVESMTDIIS